MLLAIFVCFLCISIQVVHAQVERTEEKIDPLVYEPEQQPIFDLNSIYRQNVVADSTVNKDLRLEPIVSFDLCNKESEVVILTQFIAGSIDKNNAFAQINLALPYKVEPEDCILIEVTNGKEKSFVLEDKYVPYDAVILGETISGSKTGVVATINLTVSELLKPEVSTPIDRGVIN